MPGHTNNAALNEAAQREHERLRKDADEACTDYTAVYMSGFADGKAKQQARITELERQLAMRDSIIKELVEASQDVLMSAVILSEKYLSTFDTWPDTATIQGWEKSRWKLALKAKERMDSALAQARAELEPKLEAKP